MIARMLLLLGLFVSTLAHGAQHHLLIVTGIGGTDEYREQFSATAQRLYDADDLALLQSALSTAERQRS